MFIQPFSAPRNSPKTIELFKDIERIKYSFFSIAAEHLMFFSNHAKTVFRGIIYGMLIDLPITLVYYILLGL